MEKKNVVAISMAVPGGIVFALGMCMALVTEWGTMIPGIIVGAVGLLALILIYPIYRKVGHYPAMKANPRLIVAIIIGIAAALLLGAGMCFVLIPATPVAWQMIVGISVGVVGLVGAILNPVFYTAAMNKKTSADR